MAPIEPQDTPRSPRQGEIPKGGFWRIPRGPKKRNSCRNGFDRNGANPFQDSPGGSDARNGPRFLQDGPCQTSLIRATRLVAVVGWPGGDIF
eukprot:7112064-Pyramimonas_sp.AAC.1